MFPRETIQTFDEFLAQRGLQFTAVAIGGTALNLLGVITRETTDCDVLHPESLKKDLPTGWEKGLQSLSRGSAIHLDTLGRDDLLKSKLFAFCDRGTDLPDCVALKPTQAELAQALPWVQDRDLNPDWPDHVKTQFQKLGKKLGYGL